MQEYDFIAIGDTVIDAFIRLKDAEAHCDIDGKNCKLSMDFGAKIPYEAVHELLHKESLRRSPLIVCSSSHQYHNVPQRL